MPFREGTYIWKKAHWMLKSNLSNQSLKRCLKIPEISRYWKTQNQLVGSNDRATFKITLITFTPHTEACSLLHCIVLIMSEGLIALSYRQVTG